MCCRNKREEGERDYNVDEGEEKKSKKGGRGAQQVGLWIVWHSERSLVGDKEFFFLWSASEVYFFLLWCV